MFDVEQYIGNIDYRIYSIKHIKLRKNWYNREVVLCLSLMWM